MKVVTIKAYDGKGESKVLAGEIEFTKPETLAECVQVEGGDESKVLAHYWSAKVIAEQNKLRTGGVSKAEKFKAALIETAKADKAKGDP